MKLKIATPERVIYEADVDAVSCPTEMGEITVLPNHIPLVANLKAGELKVKDQKGEHYLFVAGGFIEVRPSPSFPSPGDLPARASQWQAGGEARPPGLRPGEVGRGLREGSKTEVIILADAAEHEEEIDIARAEEARERARKVMAEEVMDAERFAESQAALERSLARIKVGRRKKYKDVGKAG